MRNRENFENDPLILEAIDRNLISIKKDKITCAHKIDAAMMAFSNIIDGRGEENYDIEDDNIEGAE